MSGVRREQAVGRDISRAAAVLIAAVLATVTLVVASAGDARAAADPSVSVSKQQAGAGSEVTVTGKDWRPKTLLTLLICGQNAIGGTDSCANAEGRAVTTDAEGAFKKKVPVAEPPKPCPCVIRATTVTGEHAFADAEFAVAGHPVKPLPEDQSGGERISVLAARLEGSGGLLAWFGAPPQRKLVLTVANQGSAQAEDPVFQVGTSHGVFAPQWADQQWRGTVDPGKKAQVKLDVELPAGSHGDYRVAVRYGGKVLAEQPWDVGRPWGVTLFWALLFLVVPAAIFRIGMAIVDRVRPRAARKAARARHRLAARLPRPSPNSKPTPESNPRATTASLPWFTPDTLASTTPHTLGSAPDEQKGQP